MEYIDIDQINDAARDPWEFIRWSQERYQHKIEEAGAIIAAQAEKGKPLVLLAGPSGSGKTTTAHRIQQWLSAHGHPSHTLSMDNYYYRRADGVLPLDDEGQVDYESPELLDLPLLREHLEKMAEGKPVDMPIFDFAAQKRSDKTIPVLRRPGEIIVMEGIHALNPQLLGAEEALATGVYISVRTRIRDEHGLVLHPSLIRLCRRFLRDKSHRARPYAETLDKLRSVSRGERLYINPYKALAEVQFDTFIPYELSVYRNELLLNLNQVEARLLEDSGAAPLVPILRQLDPISQTMVPEDALIQEFIGDED